MANKKAELLKAKALDALLESNSLTEAAAKAGINRKTLYGYIHNDAEFALNYKAAQERRTLERMDAIEADRQRATAAIFALMDDVEQPGMVRLKAAQTILEAAEGYQQRADAIATNNVEAHGGLTDNLFMPTIVIRRPGGDDDE